jgi:hypothetical protein
MSMVENSPISGRKTIFIVGSCVTRDAFDRPGHSMGVADYVARTSFACSMRAAPFSVPFASIDPDGAVESNWQRRMVEIDLSRGLRRRLRAVEEPDSTMVVVDFIDERFHLLALAGELATSSVELQRTGCAERFPDASSIRSGSDEHFDLWAMGFSAFVAEVKALGMVVILNRVYWATDTSDSTPLREPQDYIETSNRYLDRLYEMADALGVPSINYGSTRFVAAATHRWGPAPFHYVEEVYDRFLGELSRFATSAAVADRHHLVGSGDLSADRA